MPRTSRSNAKFDFPVPVSVSVPRFVLSTTFPHIDPERVARQAKVDIEVGKFESGGCGQIANDDDASPWAVWEALEPPSDMAVRLGFVRPMPCPECEGKSA